MRKKPAVVVVVVVLQTIFTAVLICGAVYLGFLIRSAPAGKTPEETREILFGLKIAAWGAALCAVPVLLACWAMWRNRRWGWWVAVVFYLISLAAMLYGPVIEHEDVDTDDMAVAAVFFVLIVLLFLPPVLRFYLRGMQANPAKEAKIPG